MKVLALNSSARTGSNSKTELMLNHLVKGMRQAGAEVETINLREKKIKVCIGCYNCWTKTPGRCIHQDDMTEELFSKWLAADICIYAVALGGDDGIHGIIGQVRIWRLREKRKGLCSPG